MNEIVKVIELIGSSEKSWDEAAKNALNEASKTLRNIIGIEVIKMTAKCNQDNIINYKTTVKIAFKKE